MSDATIIVSGLRKRFGPTVTLDGMSFTVQPGQVTGFVGPNGAGKTIDTKYLYRVKQESAHLPCS